MIKAMLFDLDGTLVDTAPDLAFALNQVLQQEGKMPLDYQQIRPWVSHGGLEMIKRSFTNLSKSKEIELWQTLVQIYQQHIADNSGLFAGMDKVLNTLEQQSIPWGIVTNKPHQLTQALLKALHLQHRAAVIVSGDSLRHKKPHPEPLYFACHKIKQHPRDCVYIGDAERDIKAGIAAGLQTIAAAFGYLDGEKDIQQWGADTIIQHPHDLLEFI